MSVAVVIASRLSERELSRCLAAYADTTRDAALPVAAHVVAVREGETVSSAWLRGAQVASASWRQPVRHYLHFGEDCYEPHPGWVDDAVAAAKAGKVASPAVWTSDGWPLVHGLDWTPGGTSLLPFLTSEMLAALTSPDEPISGQLRAAGYETVHRTGYAFTLHQQPHEEAAGPGRTG